MHSIMNHRCRHCHFLAKEYPAFNGMHSHTFTLNKDEREKAESSPVEMIGNHYSLKCHMGVWDEGVIDSTAERKSILNEIPRASGCFFFPYRPAMLFDAARELQKRSAENEQLKMSNLYTRLGLWVAAGALAVNALVVLIK